MMRSFLLLLCLLVFASAALADTAAIVGLIGKATNQTRAIGRDLDALGDGPVPRAVLDDVLARHLQAARDLRTAFALARVPPGYSPAARVPGLSVAQVNALNPNGFYYAAVSEHRRLNARLAGLVAETAPDALDVVNQAAVLPGY